MKWVTLRYYTAFMILFNSINAKFAIIYKPILKIMEISYKKSVDWFLYDGNFSIDQKY